MKSVYCTRARYTCHELLTFPETYYSPQMDIKDDSELLATFNPPLIPSFYSFNTTLGSTWTHLIKIEKNIVLLYAKGTIAYYKSPSIFFLYRLINRFLVT